MKTDELEDKVLYPKFSNRKERSEVDESYNAKICRLNHEWMTKNAALGIDNNLSQSNAKLHRATPAANSRQWLKWIFGK